VGPSRGLILQATTLALVGPVLRGDLARIPYGLPPNIIFQKNLISTNGPKNLLIFASTNVQPIVDALHHLSIKLWMMTKNSNFIFGSKSRFILSDIWA